jgi:hypothetical protein
MTFTAFHAEPLNDVLQSNVSALLFPDVSDRFLEEASGVGPMATMTGCHGVPCTQNAGCPTYANPRACPGG